MGILKAGMTLYEQPCSVRRASKKELRNLGRCKPVYDKFLMNGKETDEKILPDTFNPVSLKIPFQFEVMCSSAAQGFLSHVQS